MQYLLSDEEFKSYLDSKLELESLKKNLPSIEELQKVCTKIANEWPTFKGWDGKRDPMPWGCVLTEKYDHYCDRCPVRTICPNKHKEWSK